MSKTAVNFEDLAYRIALAIERAIDSLDTDHPTPNILVSDNGNVQAVQSGVSWPDGALASIGYVYGFNLDETGFLNEGDPVTWEDIESVVEEQRLADDAAEAIEEAAL